MTAEQILSEIKALPALEREQLLERVRQFEADEIPKDFDEALDDFEQQRFVLMEGFPNVDYRERFLKMWGPKAFESGASVAEEFAELRQGRVL